jgi:hypothetical protein
MHDISMGNSTKKQEFGRYLDTSLKFILCSSFINKK